MKQDIQKNNNSFFLLLFCLKFYFRVVYFWIGYVIAKYVIKQGLHKPVILYYWV